MILILFGVFLVLLFAGVPVAVSLGIASAGYVLTKGQPLVILPHSMLNGLDSFTLLAIPFFVLAGNLMNTGGIADRIFRFAAALVGHVPGGLAHVNVVNSIVVSGMTGSAVADAAGMGNVEIQSMKREGFTPEFAAAVTAASATIGPIIPPSIPMVVYGVLAEVSVGRLFIGGILPGLLMGAAMMGLIYLQARRRGYPTHPRVSLGEALRGFLAALPCILAPVIIVGSIVLGVASPTEASVIAVVYTFVLGMFVYRELTWRQLWQAVVEAVETSAYVLLIVAVAALFGWILTSESMATHLLKLAGGLGSQPWLLLLVVNVLLLLLGMFMETLSIMLIAVPLLMPLLKAVGVDPVHFGVVLVLNLMIGLLTPPFGLGLFVSSKLAGTTVERTFREVAPFLVPLLAVLIAITYIPSLVTWLPGLMMK